MVWEHSVIHALASTLGVDDAPQWPDTVFDSVWIINYQDGKAKLSMDTEGLNPSTECSY